MLALDDVKPILVTEENKEELLSKYSRYGRPFLIAALKLGLQVWIYSDFRFAKVSDGENFRYFSQNPIHLNSQMARYIAHNKFRTNSLLLENNIPVPASFKITSKENVEDSLKEINIHFPVVIKPSENSSGGKGVQISIQNTQELEKKLVVAFEKHPSMLIEESYEGLKEYRVIVLDNRVIAVGYKKPAYVVGDSKHTLNELIDMKDAERVANNNLMLSPIPKDDNLHKLLKVQNVTLDDVVPANVEVQLNNIGNLGSGGEMFDVTDSIHESTKDLCVKATKVLTLRYSGIDILCEDISLPFEEQRAVFLEVNTHPGIPCHIYPQKGKPQQVAHAVVRAIFDL